MIRRIVTLAALVLLAFGLLTGCDQLGSTNAIIGSIFTNFSVNGGTAFHVLVLASTTTIDPSTPGSVDSAATVARFDGSFPGGIGDALRTTNYLVADVPEGTYYIFAWIDDDDSGTFEWGSDMYGFYDGYDSSTSLPDGANVVVPAVGVVDIDMYFLIPS